MTDIQIENETSCAKDAGMRQGTELPCDIRRIISLGNEALERGKQIASLLSALKACEEALDSAQFLLNNMSMGESRTVRNITAALTAARKAQGKDTPDAK